MRISFLLALFLIAVAYAGTSYSADDDELTDGEFVLRYRRLDAAPCALLIHESPEDGTPWTVASNMQWESRIDSHLKQVKTYITDLKDSPNLVALRRMHEALRPRDIKFNDLKAVAPIAWSDWRTRYRWQALVDRGPGYRITMTRLRDFSRLGTAAEFLPAVCDVQTRSIRVNLNFDYDAWIESFQSYDIAEPNTVLVQQIAFAEYAEKTLSHRRDVLEPEQRILDIIVEVLNSDSEFVRSYILHGPLPPTPQDEERLLEVAAHLKWDLWYLFGQRYALKEAIRFYRTNQLGALGVRSLLFDTLSDGSLQMQKKKQMNYIAEHWGIPRPIVETFWDDFDAAIARIIPARN